MFDEIKDIAKNILKSRLVVLAIVMIVLCAILLQRIFVLQIVNGDSYQENYTLRIVRERTINSTRGNIYDVNGELLAYNELAYSVTIEDTGSYDSTKEKNKALNAELLQVLEVLDKNGDEISNEFGISLNEYNEFEFNVEGTALNRFRADIFGHTSIDDLEYNDKMGFDEATATPDQIMEYLSTDTRFGLTASDYEDVNDYYRLVVLRYALSQYSYTRYISATIATDVSDETVAYIEENSGELQGVAIEEDTIRKYVDSKYFAHIIGYTGKISQDEYDTLSEENEEYTLNDVIGKSGIEQVMESELQGSKGSETVYVNNLGKVIEVTDYVEPSAGNDVYLSIDKELTKAVYDLLEQELAGILYSKIVNLKDYDPASAARSSDILIPIYDVYFALINNNVLDINHFAREDASSTEQSVYATFSNKQQAEIAAITAELTSASPTVYENLSEEMQEYMSYVVTMLTSNGILDSSLIDTSDEIYQAWRNDTISLNEYLTHAISKGWIDITHFDVDTKYSDSSELYATLVEYITTQLAADKAFSKKLYHYLIDSDQVTGTQLCLMLYDQGVLTDEDGSNVAGLSTGATSAFTFLKEKINNIEITPAQLALDPCSASTVLTNVNTGQLLAVVSYPGYDNNELANTVNSDYYAALNEDLSLPLYNYATQQKTAPGSTFKMAMAAAGLAEGVIDVSTQIEDHGEFTAVTPSPRCWAYPSTHGLINVSEAIRDSCNYFFYEVGYRMSQSNGTFNEDVGTEKITKYASMFGLDTTTGIEIPESSPSIADEYPIRAAIGQSNNSFTTTQLARYVTAVANKGTVFDETLLSKVTDSDGNVIQEYAPEVAKEITEVSDTAWNAIHSGMRMVVESHAEFDDFPIAVSGKTGTAQQITTRANHALFVAYAPSDAPEVSIATRIAFGYSSSNAALVSKNILSYYFGVQSAEELLTNQASNVSGAANTFGD